MAERTFTIEVVEDTVPALAVIPDQMYTRGVAITALELPEATGGNGDLRYELVGDLPDGLGLRGRTLSGTPTAVQAATTYTWKATDADDDVAERTFTIEVVEDTVPALALIPDQMYTRGVTITALELPEATGGNGDLRYELVGDLPDGLGLRADAERDADGGAGGDDVHVEGDGRGRRRGGADVHDRGVDDTVPALAVIPDQVYTRGVTITALELPEATGGNGDLRYELVGDLPDGLGLEGADAERDADGGAGGDDVHVEGDGRGRRRGGADVHDRGGGGLGPGIGGDTGPDVHEGRDDHGA